MSNPLLDLLRTSYGCDVGTLSAKWIKR